MHTSAAADGARSPLMHPVLVTGTSVAPGATPTNFPMTIPAVAVPWEI